LPYFRSGNRAGVRGVARASGNLTHTLTGHAQLEDIANPANNHDLVIGDGFGGQINSLKWYNWNGQPVMTFADGTTQTTVTLPAPTDGTTLARQELVVRSTGRLQENGSQLGLLRVAIHTNKVRQYASLLSTDTFTALAGQYVNTLVTDAPPINLSGLTPQQNLLGNPVWPQTASHSFLISNAYAAEEGLFSSHLLSCASVIPKPMIAPACNVLKSAKVMAVNFAISSMPFFLQKTSIKSSAFLPCRPFFTTRPITSFLCCLY